MYFAQKGETHKTKLGITLRREIYEINPGVSRSKMEAVSKTNMLNWPLGWIIQNVIQMLLTNGRVCFEFSLTTTPGY